MRGREATDARPIDRVWMLLPAALPAFVAGVAALGTIDLAYHLRLGEVTMALGRVAQTDSFTFSAGGETWVNQQWAAQIVLALLYRAGGWATLGVAQMASIGFSFWLVARAAVARGAGPRAAGLLSVIGFLVAAPNLSMRPQLLALPIVAGCVFLLADRRRHPPRLWLVPVAAMMLANIHGSFVLVPLLVGLAWLEDTIEGETGRRRLIAVGVTSIVATLLNPYGIGAWVYVVELSTNPIVRDTIAEWAPVTVASLAGWLMVGSATALGITAARRAEPVAWGSVITLAVFFVMAMQSQRGTLWWSIVAPVVVAPLLSWGRTYASDDARPVRVESRAPARAMTLMLVAAVVVALPWWRTASYEASLRDAPPGITAEVRRLPPGSRVFVHQPWASWIEHATPDVLVFVDSRVELFTDDVWSDYDQVAFAGARWHEVLDRWQPDAIVAEADWDLLPFLREDPAWRVAYEDGDGVVFVRT
jgi:hypothetical protein